MRNRIYFYANFGDWNKPPYGGGEAGNRKTLELFRQMDVEVVLIPKYLHVDGSSISKNLLKLWRIIFCFLRYFIVLLFGRRNHSIVHISGYYGRRLKFEYILFRIAKILGYRVVYEMRAGGATSQYDELGEKYRKDFDYVIKNCDKVFSQGLENYPLLEKIKKDIEIYYYPNYVMSGFFPTSYPCKPLDIINFMYFGRLSELKNIDMVIDIFEGIASSYANVHLLLVGNFISEDYKNHIKSRIKNSKFNDIIDLEPACSRDDLKIYLKDQHFFLFPSKEAGEGHSNALTEAMSWGVVPICSSQGFNRGVVGNDALIVDDLKVEKYIKSIDYIIDNNLIDVLSKKAYHRVLDNYTDVIALQRMNDVYESMFNEYFGNEK